MLSLFRLDGGGGGHEWVSTISVSWGCGVVVSKSGNWCVGISGISWSSSGNCYWSWGWGSSNSVLDWGNWGGNSNWGNSDWLLVDVGLSSNLGVDVGLSSDFGVDILFSWDFLMDISLSGDLFVNVWLSNWVDLTSIVVWVDSGVGHWGGG